MKKRRLLLWMMLLLTALSGVSAGDKMLPPEGGTNPYVLQGGGESSAGLEQKNKDVEAKTYTVRIAASDYDLGYVEVEDYDDDVYESSYSSKSELVVTVTKGTEITLYAYLYDEELAYFSGWSKGETAEEISLTVTSNITITANFVAYNFYNVHIAASDYDLGWVYAEDYGDSYSSKQAIDIQVKEGTTLYLEADAYEAYRVKSIKWVDTQSQEEYPSTTYQNNDDFGSYFSIEVNSDLDITANFEECNFYNVHIAANDYNLGYVWIYSNEYDANSYYDNTDLSLQVKEGSTIEIGADPYDTDNAEFVKWNNETTDNYFIVTVTQDIDLTAIFSEYQYYNVHIAANNYDLGWVYGELKNADSYDSYDSKQAIDFQVKEGSQIDIGAIAYSPNFVDFVKWSDGSTNAEFTTTVTGDINLTAEFKEKEHPTPETGYTQLGSSKLYYAVLGESAIDIHGVYNSRFYQSTYSNEGYKAAIKVGNNSAQMLSGYAIDGVSVQTTIDQQSKFARIIYTVTNNASTDRTVSLGVWADVQIGDNDAAPVVQRKSDGKVFGLTMDDANGAQFCVLFGAGISGVSPVSDFWFGQYDTNSDVNEIVGNYYGDEDANYMVENGDYDSGMGWCWKNRTIAAGESTVFSYLIAVGDVSLEPNSSIAITPNDMSSWNDLSAVHSLFVEGLYDGVLNGTIEYAVEDAEEWLPLVENIASGEHFDTSINVKFDETKNPHKIRFRTRDIMGNIHEMKSAEYKDISTYSVTGGIGESYIYTGEPIELEGLTTDLEDEELYQFTYINNVNVGTATLYFEGVFPYSIGRNTYTFEIEPADLKGTINPKQYSVTYSGSAIEPGFTFSNSLYYSNWGVLNLVQNKDFTVTYTNNVMPGTATITVTGKGNYKGTLTTTFEILKRAFTADLYTVTLPEQSILYDGNRHDASVELLAEGMGAATLIYINRITGEEAVPQEEGIYDIYLSVAEGSVYYGSEENLYLGMTNIYTVDDGEWEVLQAIYADLITREWAHPWDMSKGKAGIANMAGITLSQGHVTGLDLSNNNLNGTFPTSVLYLPYMESLNLSGNHLGGQIENGLDAYSEWLQAQGEEEETVTVYVQKPTQWSSVWLWAWTGKGNNLVDVFDTWPGVEMTETANGWWKYSGLPKGVSVVLSDEGYDQSSDIPDNGTSGGFDSDTWIVMTNEMIYNGSYGYAAEWWSDPVKGLRHINIAGNQFEGNIGAFAAVFPDLNTLQAQNNRIEQVSPMISANVTALNIGGQTISTQRTIDLTGPITKEELLQLIPQVMLYNHAQQTYLLNGLLKIEDSMTEPTWTAGLTVSGNQVTFTPTADNAFYFTSEDVLYVVESSTGMSFPVNILFNEGDANFDSNVDVLDLQAIINFITGEYSQNRPFNSTAADLFKDGVINIQDIILHINLLLQAEEIEQSVSRRMVPEEEEQAQAWLTWQDGELHLYSEKLVAAMDLTVTADNAIEWSVPTHTVRSTDSGNSHKAIVYSLGGNTLPAETDIVIARCSDADAQTVKAVLSDRQAGRIPAETRTVHAGVPTATDAVEAARVSLTFAGNTLILHSDEALDNAQWMLYDMTGKTIAGGTCTTAGGSYQLTTGIRTGSYMFVLREQTGKIINIQKTILK